MPRLFLRQDRGADDARAQRPSKVPIGRRDRRRRSRRSRTRVRPRADPRAGPGVLDAGDPAPAQRGDPRRAQGRPAGDELRARRRLLRRRPRPRREVPGGPRAHRVPRDVRRGLLSGLLGIGSGAFKVLAMDYFMRLPMKVSTATSNFMIGITAAASAGIYFGRGDIHPVIATPVALGVLLGSYVGTRLIGHLPNTTVRKLFLPIVLYLAVSMLLRGLGLLR